MNLSISKLQTPTPTPYKTLLTFTIPQTRNFIILMFEAASEQTPLSLIVNLCGQGALQLALRVIFFFTIK